MDGPREVAMGTQQHEMEPRQREERPRPPRGAVLARAVAAVRQELALGEDRWRYEDQARPVPGRGW